MGFRTGPDSNFKIGVIGNKADDLPSDESSHQKIMNPLEHGSGVSLDDLSFSSLMQPPTQFGQQSFPGGLDPGTIIYYLAQEGMNGGIILGHSSTTNKGGSGAGNLGGQNLQSLRQSKRNVNVPPEIEEKTERGAKVKKPKEKGEQHSLDMLDGLPIHGALFDLTGFRFPEIKKVPTAKKKGSEMVSQDMMNQLMGQIQSMSGMLKGLAGKGGGGGGAGAGAGNFGVSTMGGLGNAGWGNTEDKLTPILNKLSPELKTALSNYARLVQGVDNLDALNSVNEISYLTGDIVDPETVLSYAEQMIPQATSLSDLMYIMRQLQSNTAYHGLDKIQNVTINIDSAWGEATKTLNLDGEVSIEYSEAALKEMEEYERNLANNNINAGFTSAPPSSGAPSSGGGGGGSNIMGQMFGKAQSTMQELMKRLPMTGEKESTKMTQKLNHDQVSQKLMEIAKKTINGGDPLSKDLFS